MIEHAGHLPGLTREALRWRAVGHSAWGESATIALPELDEAQAAALCAHVRDNARAVRGGVRIGDRKVDLHGTTGLKER